MPSVVCSNCSKKYRVDDSAAGKKFACKQCGNTVRVPALVTPPQAAVPVPVAKKKIAPPPMPDPVVDPAAGDVDFDALESLESSGEVDSSVPFVPSPSAQSTVAASTPKAAKKFSAPRIGFRINRIIIIVIGLGIGALVWGGKEWMLASSASATAKDITCADLAANGPGDNVHVRVTDFFSMRNYVWEKTEQQQDWETVWLPIVPRSAIKGIDSLHTLPAGAKVLAEDLVDSGNIHVLIKTHNVKNEGQVEPAMHRDSVEGLVINKIESLTEKERDLLHQAYPAFSENNCYILEDGRQPQGGLAGLLILGGVVIIGFGLFLMFKPA
jgi:hypothetical protein